MPLWVIAMLIMKTVAGVGSENNPMWSFSALASLAGHLVHGVFPGFLVGSI
jgi:hypothetical protein